MRVVMKLELITCEMLPESLLKKYLTTSIRRRFASSQRDLESMRLNRGFESHQCLYTQRKYVGQKTIDKMSSKPVLFVSFKRSKSF